MSRHIGSLLCAVPYIRRCHGSNLSCHMRLTLSEWRDAGRVLFMEIRKGDSQSAVRQSYEQLGTLCLCLQVEGMDQI